VDAVRALAVSCGALPVVLSAGEHDAAVALVSHLPQVASSALAAQLDRPGEPRPGTAPTELAGPGLQDMTRIAGGDPDLWLDILATNAARVAPLVRALAADLEATADALDALAGGADRTSSAAAEALREVLARGNRGRARVPVKGGRALVPVVVAVRDEPGQLAALLADAASSGVNVEDVHVEHLPHRDRGMVELLVAEAEQDRARRSLGASGWDVRPA
jgi:prephenate dehydrogenase